MKAIFVSLAAIGLIVAGSASAEISVADCEAQIVANKNLQILKGKLDLLNTANQPIEILANNKTPNKNEKAAISLWVDEQKRCSAPGIEYHKSQSPEVGAILEQAYAELFISAADLYQGKITYGDFAKASVRRHQGVKERIAVVIAKFREQQAEKAQREAIARQQEVVAKQQELDRQKYIHQERCESLRQQISIAANSGPTPYQVQQQQQARSDAQANAAAEAAGQSPGQIMARSYSQIGSGLAGILAPMLGMVNPAQEAAQHRQVALMQQVEIYKRNCQN